MSTAQREHDAMRDWQQIDDIIHRLRPFATETSITFTFGDKSKLVVSAWVNPSGMEKITRFYHFQTSSNKKPPTKPHLAPLDDIEQEFLKRSSQ